MSKNNIEAIYALSPMQQGMHFHTLTAPESGVYVQQFCCRLRGPLDEAAFERAWQRVVERHSVLRTAFVWKGLENPMQVVHRKVRLDIERDDWGGEDEALQGEKLARYLAADRARDFVATRAPLMRVSLLRLGETERVMVWTHHHMLLDGWSLPLLLGELFTLYGAERAGAEARLPAPRPFRDYIQWIKRQDAGAAERYWRERLEGVEGPTKLPVESPPQASSAAPAESDYVELQLRLTADATRRLNEYAKRHRLTLNTLAQGAWAYLLSRYSGQAEAVYGTTVNGRPTDLAGAAEMVGLFINTLPLRVGFDPRAPLVEWLRDIQRQQGESELYAYNTLADIQGWSAVPRGTPLFETILVFENLPVGEAARADLLGLAVEQVQLVEHTNYPLTAVAVPGAELTLLLSSDTRRFDADASRRILRHWATALESIADEAASAVGDLRLLTAEEGRQLLSDWSGGARPYPADRCVHQLFEEQAARIPSQLAVVSETEQLTYSELNRRANQLAHLLISSGVGAETRVGVCLERSPLMLVGLLGVLKAGGAYVPLDPKYPAERLAYMLADSDVHLLVTQRLFADSLPVPHGAALVLLDDEESGCASQPADDPAPRAVPDNLAYVIYTSGSTGNPKGVAVRHQGVVNYTSVMIERIGLNEASRFLQFASLSFDASVVQIYPTLLSGATLVTHRAPAEIPNLDLLAYCEEKGVTVLDLPAGFWQQWVEEVLAHNRKLRAQFEVYMTGGDKTSPQTLHKWASMSQANALFISSYGPTEGTVGTTLFTTTRDEVLNGQASDVSMGRPLANTRVYVLDPRDWRPVPAGVPGELFIGGAGVTRNYLNAPALTAEKFVPDPFGGEPGGRLYRTGDLVRPRPGGELEFLGRIDQQVKIRGARIELGEVEAALKEHPSVRECVALVGSDGAGDKHLVGYLTLDAEETPTPASLRQFYRKRLPEHMVPTAFVVLAEMPLTPNGKIDKQKLLEMAPADPGLSNDYVAPRTAVEETLAAVWRDVLKAERVGAHDNFFALGGHSLIATQLISRVRDVFHVEVPLSSLFEQPTVAELGRVVQEALQRGGGQQGAPPLQREPRPARLPLSYAQERLWFIEQLEGGTPIFNLMGVVNLTGRLDTAALEQSLNRVIERHESLRTKFGAVDGVPVQIVLDERPISVAFTPSEAATGGERQAVVRQSIQDEAARPFDLAAEPLVRATLLGFDEGHHTLILTMHHIVSDGWSVGVLIREVVAQYHALVEGRPAAVAPLPVQYADYALWQRKWLVEQALESELAYWRGQLEGAPPILELPPDFPRPPRQTYAGAQELVELEPELLAALKRLARQEGATLFMVLLAAFKSLIYRYLRRDDIVVGTPVAGRQQTETESLIGFFLNTLVLRTDLSGKPDFRTVLRRVREVCLGAYAHQNVSFERLIEELQPEREQSRSPLVQVIFNMLNLAEEQAQLPGLTIEGVAPEDQWSRFDLTLYAGERDGVLFLNAVYNRDLYAAETIRRLLKHYVNLLGSVAERPEQSLDSVSFLTAEETVAREQGNRVRPRQAFTEFVPQAVEQSIPERFETQAELYPQKVALKSSRHELTYQELSLEAARVASVLRQEGGQAGDGVALLFNHEAPLVAAILGALKAGKQYVPLDPTHPAQRLVDILADADCEALLTEEANLPRAELLARRLAARGARPLRVLNVERLGETLAIIEPAPKVWPEALAYLLYTSGSTGAPKGVMQNHRNVLHHTRAYTNALHLGAEDRLLLIASYTFDAAVMDIYGALLNGATLYLYDLKREGFEAMAGYVRESGITVLHCTPTVFRHFVAHLADGERLEGVRLLVLGGEQSHAEDFAAFKKHFAEGCLMVNGLGPTESTLALQYFLDHDSELRRQTIPVGYPVADTELLLLDEEGEESGLYGIGEIAIRSAHLALGYWRQPELTAEAFLPAEGAPLKRLYRTGDIGRRLGDQSVEFLGRKDFQIKIHGQRVVFGEIEARLSALPEVQAAAVVPQTDAAGEHHLVAYLVGAPDAELQTALIRQSLRDTLPEFMIPRAFVVLEQLPLTGTGKVNRKALPPVDLERRESEQALAAPRTPIEEILAGVWRDVLRRESVGINEDFFAIGGHSLLATQVVSRAARNFGVHLELREVFERPTIAQLAERVLELHRLKTRGHVEPIQRVSREGQLPLANAQKRLWFINQLEPGNPAYNMAMGFRLTGRLDEGALEWSLNQLVVRHETLRTTIGTDGGRPFQSVGEPATLSLNVVRLGDAPEEEREAAAREIIRREVGQPFDLAAGPLFRHLVVSLDAERHFLWLTLHHIICDGWSLGVIIRELTSLYSARVAGLTRQLPALPIQYADFAVWQSRWLSDEALKTEVEYWKAQLGEDFIALNLPLDYPRSSEMTFRGAHLSLSFSQELTDGLRRLSQQLGSTLFMTVLTAWKVLLARYCGQTEIVVGTPVAGRTAPETESLVGMFVNTLVLRTSLDHNPPFAEALRRVKKVCLEAYAHQDLPFEELVSILQPTRDLSRVPLFEIMFNWLSFAERSQDIAATAGGLAEAGLTLQPLAVENSFSKFDMSVILGERPDGMSGTIEFNTNLFAPQTIERLIANFGRLLESVVREPGERIEHLPLLTEAERAAVLYGWNRTAADYPADLCAHQFFELQARRTPDATALVFGEQTLSYRALNESANRLAHYLRRAGVGPEVLVGISLERSPQMVVALLGVLKAGGAYVPLDPEYPEARLNYVAVDAGVKALLTTEGVAAKFASVKTNLIRLDAAAAEIAAESCEDPPNLTAPDNLLYMIYTSGSTGRPKGAMNTHRGVCNRQFWKQRQYSLVASDSLLQLASFGFDFSVWEILGTLAAGARLVIPEPGIQRDPARLVSLIQSAGVTVIHFVPSLLNAFLAQEGVGQCRGLRLVLAGGEALPFELQERFFASLPAKLVNQYGPTEASIDVTFWDCERDSQTRRVPIGRPNANNRVYVLDRHLQPVPVGVGGELYIGGAGVGRGYWSRPGLTAEKFLPDPYGSEPGARMYRTGDLARFVQDGALEFLGRVDHQVKVRGFRIELGEIEAALAECAAVAEAAVLFREEPGGERRVVAYVVPRPGHDFNVMQLREDLGRSLPDHMIPAAFVRMEAMPLLPSGKLDRNALPAPGGGGGAELGEGYAPPTNEVEERLAEVWASVLNIERVGVRDNYFALGGDSILSIQIVVRAKEVGLHFNPRQMFQHQTIAELATVTSFNPPVSAEQGTLSGPVPLLPIQLDFFERRLPEQHHFTQALMIDPGAEVDVAAARRAVEALLAFHDALRMRFRQTGDGWQQSYAAAEEHDVFAFHDLSDAPAETGAATFAELVDAAQRSLDLEAGPLFRAALFKLGADKGWRLLLVAHHLVVDGVSWRVAADDLWNAYQQAARGEAVDLGRKTSSYRQWAAKLREARPTAEVREAAAYWLRQGGLSQSPWPVERPDGRNEEAQVARVRRRLDAAETASLLKDVPQAYGLQITEVLLAAFGEAVRAWGGAGRVLVAVENHGRDEPGAGLDLTRTVGWFTTVTPLLVDVSGADALWERVRRGGAGLRGAVEAGWSFRRLRYLDPAGGEAERLRLEWEPAVSLNYLGQVKAMGRGEREWAVAEESVGAGRSERGARRYELDVTLVVVKDELEITLAYGGERYGAERMEALAAAYVSALRQVVASRGEVTPGAGEEPARGESLAQLNQQQWDELVEEVEFEY
ncbi:MAG TPA: amino acid adenylation domain-containing protein [Pyrinomonadaceae bacterium]